MIEITGDFWKERRKYDAICVTTNGMLKNNGDAVMGAGIALGFAKIFPELSKMLGKKLKEQGNNVYYFLTKDTDGVICNIITFPTKNDWRDKSDMGLIRRSTEQLVAIANTEAFGLKSILLPRPGVSNGGLLWDDVRALIAPILDDRFTVITQVWL